MTEELKQTIKEELSTLPKEGQDVIASVPWIEIAEEIGKKYDLDDSQINSLQTETLLVLVSSTDAEFYPTNVENQVGIISETAVKVSEEIFAKIFIPIKNKLIENVRKNVNMKELDWKQNVNFFLSGGNYMSLIEVKDEPVEKVLPVFSLKTTISN